MGEERTKLDLSAPKILALMGILLLFREAVGWVWMGNDNDSATLIAWGIIEILIFCSIALIVLLSTVVDLRVEILKKIYFNGIPMILIGFLIVLINGVAIVPGIYEDAGIFPDPPDAMQIMGSGVLMAGVILMVAGLMELILWKKEMKASLLLVLFGIIYAFIEIILCFVVSSQVATVDETDTLVGRYAYYGVIGIIFLIYLLFIMQDKIKVPYIKMPYDWWTVLIIAFVFVIWIVPIGVYTWGTVAYTTVNFAASDNVGLYIGTGGFLLFVASIIIIKED